MPVYTGCKCPVCQKEFAPGDDIVVCPVCGSPHHRECYRQLGHCGNEHLHEEGRSWQPDGGAENQQNGAAANGTVLCPRCGKENPQENIFCQVCGERLTGASQNTYGGYSQNQGYGQNQHYGPQQGYGSSGQHSSNNPYADFVRAQLDYSEVLDEGITVKDLCDYVGPNNISFVLKFKGMIRSRFPVSINWCALFFGFYYCFYRKMYKLGAILLGLTLLLSVPINYLTFQAINEAIAANGQQAFFDAVLTYGMNGMMNSFVDGPTLRLLLVLSPVVNFLSLALRLFAGLFFNHFYYKHCLRQIKRQQQCAHCSIGTVEYSYALTRAGGVNFNAVAIMVVISVVGVLALSYLMTLTLAL